MHDGLGHAPLPLNRAEAVVAAFHDPLIAPSIRARFEPVAAHGCQLLPFWCYTHLVWETSPPGTDAAVLTTDHCVDIGRYNQMLFCMILPLETTARFEARIDGLWMALGEAVPGDGTRIEVRRPIRGNRLEGTRVTFSALDAGYRKIALNWFGVSNAEEAAAVVRERTEWPPHWPGLIVPPDEWPPARFACGLLFDATELPRLRARRGLAGWKDHVQTLENKARRYLRRDPQADLGEFLPWSDHRYLREHEKDREPYFWESLVLALVGLVNDDRQMIQHATRYLMCMLHTTHWTQSAESRLPGSTWDQRCFLEEMTTTSVALLLDWLDFALTDRARELGRQCLFDKGLAIIERDMMKVDEIYDMNQGAWFCRARVLGALMLESGWPRVGRYADRAVEDMRAIMDRYILADGSTHEGMGYWSLTLHAVLPALLAYARRRNLDVRSLLPNNIVKSERFVRAMSGVRPGTTLMDGDQSTDYFIGDTIPILADLFPGSVYERIVGACLAQDRPFTYFHHYVADGIFGFIFGPDTIRPAQPIVPTFERLECAGHLTSFRKDAAQRSIRIHLTGAKARALHSHLDKGAFTIELDGEPLLIDRGMVRYDDARCEVLHRTSLHNAITPVMPDGAFADQRWAEQAVLWSGQGDEQSLKAAIDLSHVWSEHMKSCRRAVRSVTPARFEVIDEGELTSARRIAFHLHATTPFEVCKHGAIVGNSGARLRVEAAWAQEVQHVEDLVDYAFRPVYRLTFLSGPAINFSLTTSFQRVD